MTDRYETAAARRTWPDRQEWAANAERAVRTRCFPHERVSAQPEDWLSTDELNELHALVPIVVKTARRALGRLIRPLGAEFIDEPKGAGWYTWHDTLNGEQQARLNRLVSLRNDRTSLNHGARRATRYLADVTDVLHGLGSVVYAARTYITELCPESDRLAELVRALGQRRDQAAAQATEEAVRGEVARRNSDGGWAKELERRANFSTGTVIRIGGTR